MRVARTNAWILGRRTHAKRWNADAVTKRSGTTRRAILRRERAT